MKNSEKNVANTAEALKVMEAEAKRLKAKRLKEAEEDKKALALKAEAKRKLLAEAEALKLVNRKEAQSKAEAKRLQLVDKLEALKTSAKSSFDFAKIANLSDKIEDKTLSAIYKKVTQSAFASDICGSAENIPTFAQFKAEAPVKVFFSNWDGYLLLRKFNKAEALASKLKRQAEAVAKK
jgi:hypothetical protein